MNENENLESNIKKYPVLFRWSHGGESIGISGSFNNWLQPIPLKKAEDAFGRGSFFSIELELPVGEHHYKYLVDDSWKYDPECAFAQDQYGNINNFIDVVEPSEDRKKIPQHPLKKIIRDSNVGGLPTMNPEATKESLRVRLSEKQKESKSPINIPQQYNVHTPPASSDGTDPEYDLNPENYSKRRSSSITRSKSDQNVAGLEEYLMEEQRRTSVLLSARTQHFGGDLVTEEHSSRAKSGGHESVIATLGSENTIVTHKGGNLVIFLVGLPGRGKTFIGNILSRHLTWIGHNTKLFNIGQYRREMVGSDVLHNFWNPSDKESYEKRTEIAMKCLKDALRALESDDCGCVIVDGTNCTIDRRKALFEEVYRSGTNSILFIESISNDPRIIESAVHEMKLNSIDYKNMTMKEATEDYNRRIEHYESIYQPVQDSENISYIKIIDVGRQIFCNQVYGYLQSKIMFLAANMHLRPRPIWLSRHGESVYNTLGKIGGDSPLSPLGTKYAEQLDYFINATYPMGTELSIWTSTMLRTGMTVERLAARGRKIIKWKQLDEIDAGICDGLTYEEVAEKMPEEYLARKKNKLFYRYPRGESYQDVIHRLEPVIIELMRQTGPILIVAHQAILRVLYGYLSNIKPQECPTVNIPLHSVIQLTPKAYYCEEVWHSPM